MIDSFKVPLFQLCGAARCCIAKLWRFGNPLSDAFWESSWKKLFFGTWHGSLRWWLQSYGVTFKNKIVDHTTLFPATSTLLFQAVVVVLNTPLGCVQFLGYVSRERSCRIRDPKSHDLWRTFKEAMRCSNKRLFFSWFGDTSIWDFNIIIFIFMMKFHKLTSKHSIKRTMMQLCRSS